MLPSPFNSEIPFGLGDDTAWLGRDVMRALQRLRRYQIPDIHSGATYDAQILSPRDTAPTNATFQPRDGGAESAACRRCLEHA